MEIIQKAADDRAAIESAMKACFSTDSGKVVLKYIRDIYSKPVNPIDGHRNETLWFKEGIRWLADHIITIVERN